MKKQMLFWAFCLALFVGACGPAGEDPGSTAAPDTATAPAPVVANDAFAQLLAEFQPCNDLNAFFMHQDCGIKQAALEDKAAADKLAELGKKILPLSGENAAVKYFGTEDFVSGIFSYEEPNGRIERMYSSTWGDLVFLSFTYTSTEPPLLVGACTVFMFDKTGKYLDTFVTNLYSKGSGAESEVSVVRVLVDRGQLILALNEREEDLSSGEQENIGGDRYLITEKGALSYDDSLRD